MHKEIVEWRISASWRILSLVFAALMFASVADAQPTCGTGTGGGTSFVGQTLTNTNFRAYPAKSLVGADFTNAQLSGAKFDGQDLTNAKFQRANLGPTDGPVTFTNTTLTNTCFVGAILDQTDFSFANITCADFSSTSLIQATFGPLQNILPGNSCRTRFNSATLAVTMINTSNWGNSNFTAANFVNLSPATFNLIGADITGAILAQVTFTGIDMTGANLTNVDFTSAILNNAKFLGATINGANFTSAKAAAATFTCVQGYGNSGGQRKPDGSTCPTAPTSISPTTGVNFSLAALKGADFTAATLDHAVMVQANLTGGTFGNASLVQASLQSQSSQTGPAVVQFTTFSGANFTNAQLAGVDFSGATLTGTKFDNTTLSGTSFANAVMPGASFQSSTLQSVNFSAAILQSAKFNGVKIQAPPVGAGFGATFACGQLGGADFTNASIAATNFGNAVMPAAAACCPAKGGSAAWCGYVNATGQTYGPVIFPPLTVPVTCPDGTNGLCNGTNWTLAPNWQTSSCNAGGVQQQMWSAPNCSGTPAPVVTFKDANLKACILATLPGQTEVLLATAQQITEVVCPGQKISDLTGLENFISLTKLDLESNALAGFTLSFQSGGKQVPSNLQTLHLGNNQLTSLNLNTHANLVGLTAPNNQLTSILLNANTYLVVLDASHNQITSFDLATQTSLSYADLSDNLLTTVLDQYTTSLGQLTALSYLDLSHNVLKTIGSVTAIAANATNGLNLRSLFLTCNPKLQCGDLGVYNGTQFPAASTSQCSAYNTLSQTWTPLTNPTCPPG
jgi:uncharacterized protein YjbI with pentapeptide repeats